MKDFFLKSNSIIVIFFITIIVTLFYIFSYNFFISKFEEIENDQNKKNINSFLTIIDNELSRVESITVDYAYWDATYDFIFNKNENYINENFREGANTLEDLNLDFMIFSNIKNQVVYSTYESKEFISNSTDFERALIKKFISKKNISNLFRNEILEYQNRYFVITKNEISTSDNKKESNGFLYSGKEITKESLTKLNKSFKQIDIVNKKIKLKNLKALQSVYIKNIKVSTNKTEEQIVNYLEFYNFDKEHLVTFSLKNNREFMEKGKETIIFFNVIIAAFLFSLLLLLYANIKILQRYNSRLAKEISLKTQKLKESNERLKYLSQTDELTKIYNRRMFFQEANKLFSLSSKTKKDLTVLMIDIDNFKVINDTYGHAFGDEVLIHFTKNVNSLLEKNYVFGRLGGEEFAIVFYGIDENEAYNLSEKIRKTIEEDCLYFNDTKVKYTISSGFSKKQNEDTLDYTLNEADKLLYNAKNSGKNCIIRQRHL